MVSIAALQMPTFLSVPHRAKEAMWHDIVQNKILKRTLANSWEKHRVNVASLIERLDPPSWAPNSTANYKNVIDEQFSSFH